MKFAQFLNETPAETEFSKAEIKSMTDSYKTVMGLKPTVLGKIKGKEVVRYDKSEKSTRFAILDRENEKVLFVSGLFYRSAFKGYTQGVIWKDDKITSSDVQKVFFDYALKAAKLIMSDDLQSKGGKAFWYKICRNNLTSDKYEIGYVDDGDFVKFNKNKFEEEFEDLYNEDLLHTVIYIKLKG